MTRPEPGGPAGHPREVLWVFLKLGLTAFGGPIAHVGYFRDEFVRRRQWLDEAAYADLVALCQFLPGPASSQVGFGIGFRRAGPLGALAAWTGFTLPSAILMIAFAVGVEFMSGPWAQAVIHGLKLVAVAVVAQAVWGMARTLTPDPPRIAIGLSALLIATLFPGAAMQACAIVLGVIAGFVLCRDGEAAPDAATQAFVSKRTGLAALAVFLLLLAAGPLLTVVTGNPLVAYFDAFYRSGALVFGGGHVVLPLLKQATVDQGWIGAETFLAGYGAAQALPGPLFSFAAFLGAAFSDTHNPLAVLSGAAIGLAGIFLPGMLVLIGVLPFWSWLQGLSGARAAMMGANAAVVGILAAALYNPVWTGAVADPVDALLAVAGFCLLTAFRTPPVWIVFLGAAAGVLRHLAGIG